MMTNNGDIMTDIKLPDSLPLWIKEHILLYLKDGEAGHFWDASSGGAPSHPAWFLNLEAKPSVHLKIANNELEATARVAKGKEREELWKKRVEYYAPYSDYQAATERQIPVAVFNPV
jgi:deazaflavin-dependent oxidoreductase (nitroreductase family)